MTRSKKWFVGSAIIFLLLLAYASYDIASKTTFPGSKPQLPNRIMKTLSAPDTLQRDSVK